MREMKDSRIEWIGQIPSNWKIERMQWHLEEKNVGNNPVQTTNILSLTNKRGVIPYEEKGNQGNKSKEDVSGYKLAYPNTIVANSMNVIIGSVGLSKYYGCVSPVYYVFQATNNANIEFFNYIFSVVGFQRELRKYANGILEIRLRVSADNILKRPVAIPPDDEQARIVDFLNTKCSEIDAISADIQKEIEILEQYKRSVITEAVTKGLNPDVEMKDSSVEWVGIIPASWTSSRLGYETYIRARLGWKGLKADEYVDEGYAFISAFNIQNNKLVWTPLNYITKERYDESPEIKLHIGDVIIVKDGAGIGKCARIDSLPMGETAPNSSIGVITPLAKLNYRYLAYYLQSAIFNNLILKLLNGMGVPHLTQEVLNKTPILLPPKQEQVRIANFLDSKCCEIDSAIETKKKQIDILDAYKKSLIYEYVTGKKEVPVQN